MDKPLGLKFQESKAPGGGLRVTVGTAFGRPSLLLWPTPLAMCGSRT